MIPPARLAVVSYGPLFFLGAAVGNLIGQDALRGLPVVPASLYLAVRLGQTILRGRTGGGKFSRRVVVKGALVLYAIVYSVLFFPRAFPGVVGVAAVPTLIIHTLFWLSVYYDPAYSGRPRRLASDTVLGAGLGFLTGLLLTFHAAGWNVRPGTIHNLSGTAFVRSDADVPILTMILAIVALGTITRHGLTPREIRWDRWRKASVAGATVLAMMLVTFFLYSRRTPILAFFAGAATMLLPAFLRRKVVFAAPVIVLVPMFWTVVSRLLLMLTQNPVVSAVLARNDPEHYLTATNRLDSWLAAMAFAADVRIQHLWGYGGSEVLDIVQVHAHNMVLQLFLEAGLLGVFLGAVVVLHTFLAINRLSRYPETRREASVLMGLLVAWTVLGGVEPTLRQFSMGHLMFLTLAAYALNRAYSYGRPQRSPAL